MAAFLAAPPTLTSLSGALTERLKNDKSPDPGAPSPKAREAVLAFAESSLPLSPLPTAGGRAGVRGVIRKTFGNGANLPGSRALTADNFLHCASFMILFIF